MEPLVPVPTTTAEAIDLLRHVIAGDVLTPDDRDYDVARRIGPAPAARPWAIVAADSTDDIVDAVRFAKAANRTVAVRASGRRIGEAADGAVLIVTSRLVDVTVDPVCRTATVAAGATWNDVAAAAAEHGLAPVLGDPPQRCAVSDLLFGGLGWQARRHGMAADHLVAIELVTPDGLLVEVSADTQPELFWAFGGAAAGSLGVVAAAEIELQPIRPVYAGALVYPSWRAAAVLDRWRAWVTGARPELTSSVVLTPRTVAVHGCWSGAIDVGRALVDGWRQWSPADVDTWCRHTSPAVSITDPCLDQPATLTSDWTNTLRDELLAGLSDLAATCTVEVRHLGGALRVRSGSAASGRGRRDQFLVTLAGFAGDAAGVRAGIAPHVTGAVLLDRCHAAERAIRVEDAFHAADWERVRAVKRALDPNRRFRHGLPIS